MADQWVRYSDIPVPRSSFASGVVDGKIYVIGGLEQNGNAVSTVYEYEISTGTWTQKADAPVDRRRGYWGVINDKIYMAGGLIGGGVDPGSTRTDEYDPATDTWTQKANAPTQLAFGGGCAHNGKLYCSGDGYASLNIMYEYTPGSGSMGGSWATKATPDVWRRSNSLGSDGTYIYSIGGTGTSGSETTISRYNPATNSWSGGLAALPHAKDECSPNAPSVGGLIFMTGGGSNATSRASHIAYNPATDEWETDFEDLVFPRWLRPASVAHQSMIWFLGGQKEDAVFASALVERYETTADQEGWGMLI